jgi:2-polyprenyl-3-methyl-5-hydroxy-6-metoxy-1,4-benzoquinol methylase
VKLDTPENIRKFYEEKWGEHGATPQGMAYRDLDSHLKRLRLAKHLSGYLPGSSILDVGCGIGLLPETWFGDEVGTWAPSLGEHYVGIDIVEEYIQHAERSTIYNGSTFITGDFRDHHVIDINHKEVPFDITVALGTLAWQPLVEGYDILTRMWMMTKRTMVFTALLDRPFSKLWLLALGERLHPQCKEFTYHSGHVPGEIMMVLRHPNG